jgi:HSP20 family protein
MNRSNKTMSTLQQLRSGLNEAWDTLAEGWQRLYRRAAGAVTRFTPGRRAAGDTEFALRSSGWGVLAAEVFDNDDRIVVRLEVPGMQKDDFTLQVLNGCLVVRGEKRARREHTQGRYRISECAYGRFERAIPLPVAVDAGKAGATYRKGILRVELPRQAVRRRDTITVDVK